MLWSSQKPARNCKESKADDNPGFHAHRRGTLTAQKVSVANIAFKLSQILEKPVADMTGIHGVFDFQLEWTPEERQKAGPTATDGPTIFTALQQQLGLKLESRKVPVEILVIDHVEKTPSEN